MIKNGWYKTDPVCLCHCIELTSGIECTSRYKNAHNLHVLIANLFTSEDTETIILITKSKRYTATYLITKITTVHEK